MMVWNRKGQNGFIKGTDRFKMLTALIDDLNMYIVFR